MKNSREAGYLEGNRNLESSDRAGLEAPLQQGLGSEFIQYLIGSASDHFHLCYFSSVPVDGYAEYAFPPHAPANEVHRKLWIRGVEANPFEVLGNFAAGMDLLYSKGQNQ